MTKGLCISDCGLQCNICTQLSDYYTSYSRRQPNS